MKKIKLIILFVIVTVMIAACSRDEELNVNEQQESVAVASDTNAKDETQDNNSMSNNENNQSTKESSTASSKVDNTVEKDADTNESVHAELYNVLQTAELSIENDKDAEIEVEESLETEADSVSEEEYDTPAVTYSRCVLHDIDNDSIDECFLDTPDGLVMYTFSDRVVSKPIEFSKGSELYFSTDNDKLYVYTNESGYESWYEYCKGFDNESLYQTSSKEYIEYTDEDDVIHTEVYIDGISVYDPEYNTEDDLANVLANFEPLDAIEAEWCTTINEAFNRTE